MSSTLLIENLISFNLTRQEATIYVALLTHGEMTGYEVAKETGFSDSSYFYRVFKKETGKTPKNFKRTKKVLNPNQRKQPKKHNQTHHSQMTDIFV